MLGLKEDTMNNTFTDEEVQFRMSNVDFDRLLLILGIAAGATIKDDPKLFRAIMRFTNEINKNNPKFVQYEIKD